MYDNKKYYQFGKEKLGPFIYGFTDWLNERLKENSPDKVFFLARDGFLMQRAFEIFQESYAEDIKNEYVYFSRKSLRNALLWKCQENYADSLKYLTKTRYISIGAVLDYYGFSDEEISQIAEENQIDLEKDVSFDKLHQNLELEKIYKKVKNKIYERSKKQYAYLNAYLQQIGMRGNIAIVDIGWHGSMQYYLEELLRLGKIPAAITGYYVGIHLIVPVKGMVYGFVFYPENLKLRRDMLCFFGICERMFQSLEGSTEGYCSQNDLIYPVNGKNEYEENLDLVMSIRGMQEGALDYIKFNMNCKGNETLSRRESIKKLMQFGKYPSYGETRLFEGFYNLDGVKKYYLPQKKIYQFKPMELIHDLSNSCWKTGFMRKAFVLPLPYYWIYVLMRR